MDRGTWWAVGPMGLQESDTTAYGCKHACPMLLEISKVLELSGMSKRFRKHLPK